MQHEVARIDSRESPATDKYLYKQVGGDLAAAAFSATLIAPSIAIIDRAIVEKIASKKSLLAGLRTHSAAALFRPRQFLLSRPLGIVWALYAITYAVANTSETLGNKFHQAAAGTITFVSTMLVNVPMGVWKDIRFAQLYGASPTVAPKAPSHPPVKLKISKAATATFLLRDGLTIFGSFTMAPAMSSMIPDSLSANAHKKNAITQMTVPVLSQLVATPVHLLGLDFHNRNYQVGIGKRFDYIRGDLPSATVVRCIRIIPAFGFGCLANSEARSFFHRVARE